MTTPNKQLSRRTMFTGAGAIGVLAAAATLLPVELQQDSTPAPKAKAPPVKGGGYHVTEHVKRYYQTTLV
jgi:hypothetical protein